MFYSMFQPEFVTPFDGMFKPGFVGGDGGIIKTGLLFYAKNGLQDTIGVSARPLQPLHYMTDGTLSHVSIAGTETVVSNGGTGSVAVSEGVLTITGTVWDILLSNGWYITFGDESAGVAWEVSGGKNLVMSGVTCGTDGTGQTGSNWLNLKGYSIADGSHYLSAFSFGLIPDDVLIPALSNLSGCAAYEVAA